MQKAPASWDLSDEDKNAGKLEAVFGAVFSCHVPSNLVVQPAEENAANSESVDE